MTMMKRAAAMLFAVCLLAAGTAGAETLSLNGTVEAGVKVPVYAPIGGTVGSVAVEQGVRVAKGDVIISYKTEKTYASLDGVVSGVFVQEGDDAETMTERFGADLYIEGTNRYTISASTNKAYSTVDTTFVHTGETVYLLCRSDAKRYGTGIITAVEGTSYTVLVTEGRFIAGDSVNIYRDAEHSDKQRIGRGSISRMSPTAVNATGAVVKVAVQDGDQVSRGDLLLETLTGAFDAYEMTGTDVTAQEEGVVTSVTAEAGTAVAKGDIIAQIAPFSGMRVAVSVGEDDRKSLKAGDKVTIELESDTSRTYEGTVRYVAETPEEDTDTLTYKAIVDFTPDEHVVFGMKVVVTTGQNAASGEKDD